MISIVVKIECKKNAIDIATNNDITQKQIWRTFNDEIGRSKLNKKYPSYLIEKGSTADSTIEKLDLLCDYYQSSMFELQLNNNLQSTFKTNLNIPLWTFTNDDVMRAMTKEKTSRCAG